MVKLNGLGHQCRIKDKNLRTPLQLLRISTKGRPVDPHPPVLALQTKIPMETPKERQTKTTLLKTISPKGPTQNLAEEETRSRKNFHKKIRILVHPKSPNKNGKQLLIEKRKSRDLLTTTLRSCS